jgi:uncharacterized small protein (TIGR04563 family)
MTQRKDPQSTDQRKQSIYMPLTMIAQLRAEAKRLDRSLSWMIQKAWSIALEHIQRMPAP